MANNDPLRVIIAGAGIAGLAATIALERISTIPNLDIQLYEQALELQEIGASIALSPNVCFSFPQLHDTTKRPNSQGMRTLEKLGVLETLSDEVGYRGPSGIPQIFR